MRTWSEGVAKHAKLIFVVLLVITFALSFGIKKLSLDTDMQDLLGIKKQSTLLTQLTPMGNDLRNTEIVVYDTDLFTRSKLLKLDEFQQQLNNIPSIDKVISLYNTPNFQHTIEINKMATVLNTKDIQNEPMNDVKHNALSNRSYLHHMINPEATALAFIVHIQDSVPNKKLLDVRNDIEFLINQYHADFQDFFQLGELENNFYSARDSMHDIALIGSLTLFVLILAFCIFFRSPYLGLAPFLTAGLAMIWTFGIMGYLNIHLNVMTSIAAIMTYTVGTMENAHFINAYQKSQIENTNYTLDRHIAVMYRAVLFPLFLTTLCTLLGFVSNFFSSIIVLKSFAITFSLAIFLNALLLCVLTPALLTFSKVKNKNKIDFILIRRVTLFIYKKTTRFSFVFSVILVSIIGFSFWAASKIPLEIMPYSYFYKSSEFAQKVYKTNQYIAGTERLFINVTTSIPGGFKNIELLDQLFEVEKKIQQQPMTSSTSSVSSIMAGAFQAFLDANDESFYRMPKSEFVFERFFKEIKKSNETEFLLSNNNSSARIIVIFHAYTTAQALQYAQKLENLLNTEFKNTKINYEIENPRMDVLVATRDLLKLQVSGVSMIYFSIFIIMMIMFRSFKAGLVSIIPNIFPISSVILALYFFNIPFNITSVIVLTGVLGMAADDTLHVLYYFKKNFLKNADNELAITQTITALVRPVSITALTFILGMSMLFFSVIKATMHYGFLMIIGAAAAWIANLTVTPFLLKKVNITKKL